MYAFKLKTPHTLKEISALMQELRAPLQEKVIEIMQRKIVEEGVERWERACLKRAGLLLPNTNIPQEAEETSSPSNLWESLATRTHADQKNGLFELESNMGVTFSLVQMEGEEDGGPLFNVYVVNKELAQTVKEFFVTRSLSSAPSALNVSDQEVLDIVLLKEHFFPTSCYAAPSSWQRYVPPLKKRLESWTREYFYERYAREHNVPLTVAMVVRGNTAFQNMSAKEREGWRAHVRNVLLHTPPAMLFDEGGWDEALHLFDASLLKKSTHASSPLCTKPKRKHT